MLKKPCILFVYLGRRGISQMVLEICSVLNNRTDVDWYVCLSKENQDLMSFEVLGERVITVSTFSSMFGSAFYLTKARAIEREISQFISTINANHIVSLMPHIWSATLRNVARIKNVRYHVVIHDAKMHPGDLTGLLTPFLLRDAKQADLVFTLSKTVLHGLIDQKIAAEHKIILLFHPVYAPSYVSRKRPDTNQKWRLLFAGRILPYKGLPLLVDALRLVLQSGIEFDLTVIGEGNISSVEKELKKLKAKIINRWVSNDEMGNAFAENHLLILPYREASQSGPAAQALAAGLPVVGTLVGGLREQVSDGRTGLLAAADPYAIAEKIEQVMHQPGLYEHLVQGAYQVASEQSYGRFIDMMLEAIKACPDK